MRKSVNPRPLAKLAVALAVTLVGAAGATAAYAHNRDMPAGQGSTAVTERVVMPLDTPRLASQADRSAVDSVAVQAPSCWTHFAPPVPDGIALMQYYRNCNGYGLYVYAGYEIGGNRYQTHACVWFNNGEYTFFYHPSTVSGSNYGNWVC